jgi:glutathionylspermidine synthase
VADLYIVDFFSCYGKLLKSTQLSDEEHDARHELICYMQTKLDDYQWATVKAFHDQVHEAIVEQQIVNPLTIGYQELGTWTYQSRRHVGKVQVMVQYQFNSPLALLNYDIKIMLTDSLL